MEHSRRLCSALLVITLWSVAASQECKQDSNCRLPDCFCPTFSHPLGAKNIPQIVYFGFDDAVTSPSSGKYDQLFTPERKNPNGCPITKTLYVSNENTEYNLVSKYNKKGDEIAVHSVTHTNIDTAEKLRKEATEQREIIERKGDVPYKDIIGWRSPNLKTAGDDQPRVLKELGFTYDISLTYDSNPNFPFPFTLDYGYPYKCSIEPCPSPDSKHEGFWEIMVHSYTDKSGLPCTYVDSCRPSSEDDAVEFLWSNFMKTYERERSPFGLNMHAAWFFFPDYLPAMGKFIDRVLALGDVYIVNVAQMIEWMKNPTPLSDINLFPPWGCNRNTIKRATLTQSTPPPAVTTAKVPRVPNRLNISSALHTHSASQNKQPEASTTLSRGQSSPTLPKLYSRHEANTRPSRINFIPARETTTTTTPSVRVPAFGQRFMNKDYLYGADHSEDRPISCVQGGNCKLPSCFCKSASPPYNLSPIRIPQIVYISVDSHIDGRTFGPLMQIFSSSRINPNGCPVTGSLFVPVTGNYPPYASTLSYMGAKLGIELGQGAGVEEINELAKGIFPLYGMRSGRVDTDYTNEVLNALKSQNTTFSNFIVKESLDYTWPFTLDFGLGQERRHPGLWHVPLAPLKVPGRSYSCLIPDSCPFLFKSELDTYQIFKYNFDRHYFTNRVPFGININERWLVSSGGAARVRGLNAFLDTILRRSDVMVISVDKLLQWVMSSGKYGPRLSC